MRSENKSVADDYVKKQREEIVRALTESKGRVGGATGARTCLSTNSTVPPPWYSSPAANTLTFPQQSFPGGWC
jgi:hypothetical protein